MLTAKIFNNGRSQAVRLPKEFRFSAKEIGISRMGDVVLLFPRGKAWDMMEKGISQFTEDFLADRDQPKSADKRKTL